MTFPFQAYYAKKYIAPFTPELREALLSAMEEFGWRVHGVSPAEIAASTARQCWTGNERIVVRFHRQDVLELSSRGTSVAQLFHWRKNHENVSRLLKGLRERGILLAPHRERSLA